MQIGIVLDYRVSLQKSQHRMGGQQNGADTAGAGDSGLKVVAYGH